ncbi:MAG: sulfotransferase family 2 domain-containing protein [Planctomycetales bacterium]|nr:sulfotransferase family 2 domain-containing protein [Planctomycetales bacterium]
MLISFEKRFLFVHVPKTGGTSMRAVLQKHADPQDSAVNRLLESVGISVNHFLGSYRSYRFRTHERLAVVNRRLPNPVFAELFKFGFVRDPWELLPSMYRFIRKTPHHKRHRAVSQMCFPTFIEFAIAKKLANQKRLIANSRGEILLDFVGKFERLEADFARVREKLGIRRGLPHLNGTKQKTVAAYYDSATVRRIQSAFADDIETFGYATEPTSSMPFAA